MSTTRINTVGFLNDTSHADSIGRLGMSVLKSGVSPSATVALVRLTCQAFDDVKVTGLDDFDYSDDDLRELKSISLIHWTGADWVKLV